MNTKPNRDITAEAMMMLELTLQRKARIEFQDGVTGTDEVFEFIDLVMGEYRQLLKDQREALDAEWKKRCLYMLTKLRMDRLDEVYQFVGVKDLNSDKPSGEWAGYNQAVDEFNEKLDNLEI